MDDDLFSLPPPHDYSLDTFKTNLTVHQSQMMSRIMYLGLCSVIYANDHDDQFPKTLEVLVDAGILKQSVLDNLLKSDRVEQGSLNIECRQTPVAASDWGQAIILYEGFDTWPDEGVVACFADGHSELVIDRKRFEEMVK